MAKLYSQFTCEDLEDKLAQLDTTIYYISDLPHILGALQSMVLQN